VYPPSPALSWHFYKQLIFNTEISNNSNCLTS